MSIINNASVFSLWIWRSMAWFNRFCFIVVRRYERSLLCALKDRWLTAFVTRISFVKVMTSATKCFWALDNSFSCFSMSWKFEMFLASRRRKGNDFSCVPTWLTLASHGMLQEVINWLKTKQLHHLVGRGCDCNYITERRLREHW